MCPPEVVDALSDQLLDRVRVHATDQIPHLTQLPLQLLDAGVLGPGRDPALQDLLHHELDVLQVPPELAHVVVPQLEARVTLDAAGEDAHEATCTLVAVPSHCALPTLALARFSVTLGGL